jgi:tRNA-specific 2-thiouridylase
VREISGDSSREGDWAVVRLRVEGDRIIEADAEGLGERLEGLSLLEAAAVAGETLPADALANALGPVFRAAPSPARTAVAMSGGVDSAVALLRASQDRADAVGVTLRLWLDPEGPAAERACCSPEAVISARETCHSLGLPHVTLDLREEFRRSVVRRFVEGYAHGETPNPCTRCNGGFRFAQLLSFARRAGASRLATGHYARIVDDGEGPLLARAADREKDQSYMLATLDPVRLDRIWFPLGDQRKSATRAEAAAAGLESAGRAESQEACFLAGGDYRDFLERQGLAPRAGAIVDEAGREVGRHDGHWRFTPGQRRGLGVAAGAPVYAVSAEPATNVVVVGRRELLARRTVVVEGRLYRPTESVEAKLRYRSPGLPAQVFRSGPDRFSLRLERPAYGVAAGQTAVLYDDDTVVGAGTIVEAAA